MPSAVSVVSVVSVVSFVSVVSVVSAVSAVSAVSVVSVVSVVSAPTLIAKFSFHLSVLSFVRIYRCFSSFWVAVVRICEGVEQW